MKSNIPKHPCKNKCTDFKEEQCKTCLIPMNLTELELTNNDFLVGDVVVLTNYFTNFSNELLDVKYLYPNGKIRVTNGLWGRTVVPKEIRPASITELNANRRLTEAEQALAEVS